MATFKHSINERNKANVLKLRMTYGAAGYGIYMMLLERLAADPQLSSELDYDILAYDFHESADLIRHVVEDFDLFSIDLDADTFTNDELYRQLSPKNKQKKMEKAIDDFIAKRLADNEWIENYAKANKTFPKNIREELQITFRRKFLESEPRQMTEYAISNLFTSHMYHLLNKNADNPVKDYRH